MVDFIHHYNFTEKGVETQEKWKLKNIATKLFE